MTDDMNDQDKEKISAQMKSAAEEKGKPTTKETSSVEATGDDQSGEEVS